MLYAICGILVLFLALYGFTELVRKLIFSFYKPKNQSWYMIINLAENSVEDIEFVLRSFCEKAGWSRNPPKRVILLDNSQNPVAKKICRCISKEYGFLEIASAQELYGIITDNKV